MGFAMTVDVEEWFTGVGDPRSEVDRYPSRIDIGMNRLLEILGETNTRATFFFLGYLVKSRPDLVRRVAAAGHRIGSHGMYHAPLWDLTPESFLREMRECRDDLGDLLGEPPLSFRAPLFSVTRQTLWAWDILEELGFRLDSSVFPIVNPRYGMPDAPRLPFLAGQGRELLVIPLSTFRLGPMNLPFSGGFYLRFFPSWLVSACFTGLAVDDTPGVCYIHPWELDPDQPRLSLGRSHAFRHHTGLGRITGKLRQVLETYHFTTLEDLATCLRNPLIAPESAAPARATSAK